MRFPKKGGTKLRRGFAFVMLFAFAFLVRQANAQGFAPPPIGPACPPQQSIQNGNFGPIVLIGFVLGGTPFIATGNCPFAQVASIGATIRVGTTGGINLNPVGIADAFGDTVSTWDSNNVMVSQGWVSAGIVGDNLDVTIDAGAISGSPGYYDAQIMVSGVDQGIAVGPSSWNLRVVVQGTTPTNLSAKLLDPVPDFLDGSGVSTSTNLLAVNSHVVQGVAADGVTQLVLGVHADNVGDQISITLLNDQQPSAQSGSPDEDGALGNLGNTTFAASQVITGTVSAGNNGPEAFAIYRAPIDFVRLVGGVAGSYKTGSCGNVTLTDDQLACRSVSLRVQDLTNGALTFATITILRPPVVMIHGLWDNWQTWNNFAPLVTGPGNADPRFSVGRVNYDNPVTVRASDPAYSPAELQKASANSLGLGFNAPSVLAQIDIWIKNFKQGINPSRIAVAAVQADIVAHSMGGDITRALVLQPSFLNDHTFGQGSIHKVITIDTPHLGSPLATQILSPQENGGCLQNLLAQNGKFVFNTVSLTSATQSASGALGDLVDSPPSPALTAIAKQGQHLLPTAVIAGVYTNFARLDDLVSKATVIRNWPIGCPSDPLAQDLTSTKWPTIFDNTANDAIVSETSQLNGLSPVFVFQSVVHSPGTEDLGFSGPSVLDPDSVTGIPSTVILLLNTPVTEASFNPLTP